MLTPRGDWAVHEWGIKWFYGKFHEFDALRGPEGVGQALHDKRLRAKQLDWRYNLRDLYVDKNPGYDWTEITGPNPSDPALKEAKQVSSILFLSKESYLCVNVESIRENNPDAQRTRGPCQSP